MLSVTLQDDGTCWAFDGHDHMAAAVPNRAFKFFRKGIKRRCQNLIARYLCGMVTVGDGDVVINFGANIGKIAVPMADAGAYVLAIEPDPYVLPALQTNARRRKIGIVPMLAWDGSADSIEIGLDPQKANSSVFCDSQQRHWVQAITVDAHAKERDLESVKLIIGDAEGAEPEVLTGAMETLKRTDFVSVCASAERRGQRTLEACEAILKDASFDIIRREETGFCTLIGKNQHGSAHEMA